MVELSGQIFLFDNQKNPKNIRFKFLNEENLSYPIKMAGQWLARLWTFNSYYFDWSKIGLKIFYCKTIMNI